MVHVEFRKGLSELVVEQTTDKNGNPVEIRSQWAAFDQGDGFPIRVKFRLFDGMEMYANGKYTLGDVDAFIEIKKFNGEQTLGLVKYMPRLKPLLDTPISNAAKS